MVRFCDICSIRNVVEQPVNSRFFRHPDMAVSWKHMLLATVLLCVNWCLEVLPHLRLC